MACFVVGTAVANQQGLHFSMEHPASASTLACDPVQRLFGKRVCAVVHYDIGAYHVCHFNPFKGA